MPVKKLVQLLFAFARNFVDRAAGGGGLDGTGHESDALISDRLSLEVDLAIDTACFLP